MPVNAFNGSHGWGYDGVLWCAVQEEYGGPAAYQALRRRLPPARPRRHPGRRLQPPRPERQLPAGVRSLHRRRRHQHLGRVAQPGRRGLRRGAPLHHRQRADVAAGLPRRRPAAGRRARPVRHPGDPPAGGAGHRGGGAVSAFVEPAAVADRRVRPERPAPDHHPRRRRLRADRAVERRLPPRPLRQPDRGHDRLLRRLRLPGGARQGVRERLLPRRAPTPASAAAATATRSTRSGRRPGGWSSAPTTTTRSATGPTASGCPASSRRSSWGWPPSSPCSARSPR